MCIALEPLCQPAQPRLKPGFKLRPGTSTKTPLVLELACELEALLNMVRLFAEAVIDLA